MGSVVDKNVAADVSKTTAASDAANWKSLTADTAVNIAEIAAPDNVVAATAGAVAENRPYAITPNEAQASPVRGLGMVPTPEVNSNSAAFAVGDKAEQISSGNPNTQVDRRSFDLSLPGAAASKKVEFKCIGEFKDAGGC